jgi:hypothetical protein
MTIRRSSTSLVNYFGAEVTATMTQGKLSNTVRNGTGNERAAEAAVQIFTNTNYTPSALKISEYEYALGFVQAAGIAPLAQKTMALVFVDAAKAQGISVAALLRDVTSSELSLVEAKSYDYINKLRDNTSQLSGSTPVSNNNSYRARYLKP